MTPSAITYRSRILPYGLVANPNMLSWTKQYICAALVLLSIPFIKESTHYSILPSVYHSLWIEELKEIVNRT